MEWDREKKNHESQLFLARVNKNYPSLPMPKIIGIRSTSFFDLIPPLLLRRRKRVCEVTKFHIAIRDKAMLWFAFGIPIAQTDNEWKNSLRSPRWSSKFDAAFIDLSNFCPPVSRLWHSGHTLVLCPWSKEGFYGSGFRVIISIDFHLPSLGLDYLVQPLRVLTKFRARTGRARVSWHSYRPKTIWPMEITYLAFIHEDIMSKF